MHTKSNHQAINVNKLSTFGLIDLFELKSQSKCNMFSLNIFICINVYAMGIGIKLLQHYQWPSPKINTKQWHSINRYIQMVMQQNRSVSRSNDVILKFDNHDAFTAVIVVAVVW